MRISSQLLRGVKREEAENYKQYLIHNKELLDRVVGILKNKLQTSVNDMRSQVAYDKSTWPFYQADQLGYQRALAEMVSILSLDQEET